MKFKPSPYQQKVFDAGLRGKRNLLVSAVAGSGKSTTIRKLIEMMSPSLTKTYLAFNRQIVDDMAKGYKDRGINPKRKFNLRISTINSFGHSEWIAYRKGEAKTMPVTNPQKVWEIAKHAVADGRRGYMEVIVEMVRLAKTYGLVPATQPTLKGFVEDKLSEWRTICDHHSLEFEDNGEFRACVEEARKVLDVSLTILDIIDFEDQLYMPLVFDIPFKNRYDRVFVDECQDISSVQRRLVAKLLKPKGKVIFVGDPHQAIYGFRGADAESIEKIVEEFNCLELPLSITYRCPKKVVELAQKIVPHLEARADAEEGVLRRRAKLFTEYKYQEGDLVLCRNNAPLVDVFHWLIENRIPCRLLQADKFTSKLTEKLRSFKTQDVRQALAELKKWRDGQRAKADKQAGKGEKASSADDFYDAAESFAKKSRAKSVAALCAFIEYAMRKAEEKASQKPAVVLATIHKAKGMEADNVYIVDPHNMPSKHAKLDWEKRQEKNLRYVAITRARRQLVYVYSSEEKRDEGEAKRIAAKARSDGPDDNYNEAEQAPRLGKHSGIEPGKGNARRRTYVKLDRV